MKTARASISPAATVRKRSGAAALGTKRDYNQRLVICIIFYYYVFLPNGSGREANNSEETAARSPAVGLDVSLFIDQ